MFFSGVDKTDKMGVNTNLGMYGSQIWEEKVNFIPARFGSFLLLVFNNA